METLGSPDYNGLKVIFHIKKKITQKNSQYLDTISYCGVPSDLHHKISLNKRAYQGCHVHYGYLSEVPL